jgi:hypothetical protein
MNGTRIAFAAFAILYAAGARGTAGFPANLGDERWRGRDERSERGRNRGGAETGGMKGLGTTVREVSGALTGGGSAMVMTNGGHVRPLLGHL